METIKKVNGQKKVIYNYHQDKIIKSEKTYYKDHMYGEENARNYKQLTPYQTWNLIGGDKPKKERLKYEKVSMSNNLRDRNVGKIAIAYTVWSKKKGGGKLIVKEVFKKIKKSNHLNRLITLSPLTEMARNFHLNNGAVELQVNEKTQNFEYKI